MTREEFVKIKFKGYMEIIYVHPRTKEEIPCVMIAVNFDNEVISLQIMPGHRYQEDEFDTYIGNVKLPYKKIKKA